VSWSKALGGGELYGSNIVKIAFIDDAGTASIKKEPFMILAGIIVDGDKDIQRIEQKLSLISFCCGNANLSRQL